MNKKLTRKQVIEAISFKYKIKKSFIVLLEDGTAIICSTLKDAQDTESSNINSIRGTINETT